MKAALLSIPTMSIVMSMDDLFGSNGIYSNPWGEGEQWERPASVEWINPDGAEGFQIDAGLKIYGNAFRGFNLTRKKSFRLLFRRDFGPAKLNFRLFDDEDATTRFDTPRSARRGQRRLERLGRGQHAVHHGRVHAADAVGAGPAGGPRNVRPSVPQRPVLGSVQRGGAADRILLRRVFRRRRGGVGRDQQRRIPRGQPTWRPGTRCSARPGRDLSDAASYQKIQGNNPDGTRNPAYDDLLDVDNYIDYMFSNFWGGTGDWPGHNYYAACRRPPNSTGFKFFNWDAEGAMVIWSSLNANVTGVSDGAAVPYAALRQNLEFCLLFADHVQKHLFHNGPVTSGPAYHAIQGAGRRGGIGDHRRVGAMGRSVQGDAVHAGRLESHAGLHSEHLHAPASGDRAEPVEGCGSVSHGCGAGLPGQRCCADMAVRSPQTVH